MDSGHTIIFAKGECPKNQIVINALRHARHIICCDGAIDNLESLGLTPTWIIGDLDSISEEKRALYKDKILVRNSQEICDLHKAILFCKEQHVDEVFIVGATGLREDHALANLSLLLTHGRDLRLRMLTDYGIFTPVFGTTTLPSFPKQQVSIFNFGHGDVTFHGLRYPVTKRTFHYFWEGSLNEATGATFTLEFGSGEFLVYQSHVGK